MSRFSKSITYPFKLFGEETQQSLIWLIFTVVCGLFGIGMNIWSHLGDDSNLYDAILKEFTVNSFYTYSIVLLTCTSGNLFMKMDKDRLMTYKSIKIWLMIVLGFFVFGGGLLCQSRGKLPFFNWFQLLYFLLAIALAVYGFCVVNMDRHPELFDDIQEKITKEDADNIKMLADKMSTVTKDNKGNNL